MVICLLKLTQLLLKVAENDYKLKYKTKFRQMIWVRLLLIEQQHLI